jgi:hypothetical protein
MNSAMIAVQLMSQDSVPSMSARSTAGIGRESQMREILPGGKPSGIVARFQPLDPGIVNEAIPAFFIGRNKEGFWVARDVKGRIGGIFLLENSARSFAKRSSQPSGCATISSPERFELDLENNGNPLVEHLWRLVRVARRPRQRMAALVSKMTEAIKRRIEGLDVR